jgi:hypothetical protein
VNQTIAETQAVPAADALALRQLQHVGAAYLLIFALLFVFAWRATAATKALAGRIDALERGPADTLERGGATKAGDSRDGKARAR